MGAFERLQFVWLELEKHGKKRTIGEGGASGLYEYTYEGCVYLVEVQNDLCTRIESIVLQQ